jgi:hypothetical protein
MSNIKPTIYSIDEESGYLYKPTYYPLFTIRELIDLQVSIVKTLKMYSDENYDDNRIHQLNEEACNNAMQDTRDNIKNQGQEKKVKKVNKTFIYIMIDHNTGYYKIGHSKNVIRRERTLQSEKPTIELLYTFEGDVKDERDLHENYKDLRVRGEWFALEQWMIDAIIKMFEVKRMTKERRKEREVGL